MTVLQSGRRRWRAVLLGIIFCLTAVVVGLIAYFADDYTSSHLIGNVRIQPLFFAGLLGLLIAGLTVYWLTVALDRRVDPLDQAPAWVCPVAAGLLALLGAVLAYLFLGVWPIGDKSVMIVDLHQQYGPLLVQLRDMLLHGGSPLYSFEIGLGSGFLPLFAYYLASPFNLLLALFPLKYLTEGILIITLLKNALTAVTFAACLQYVFRRRTVAIPTVAVMFSLSAYLMAYNWNIMWLDGVFTLPLAVLFFERMMREKKYLGYILSLAYALFTNYYIAYMLCAFMVLYFVAYALRERRTVGQIAAAGGRFALGSLLGGGIAMCLLIPTALSLAGTSAADNLSLPALAGNFNIFALFGQHLFGVDPTIRSGNLPNLYCGIAAALLLPVYLTTAKIPLRRRMVFGGLLGLLAGSLVLNHWDLLWHGLHAPNDLPYRFSFLYIFVLLTMTYETLLHLSDITRRQIGGSLAAFSSAVILYQQFGTVGNKNGDAVSDAVVFASLGLGLLYAGILTLIASKKCRVASGRCLLMAVIVAEMIVQGGVAQRQVNASEYYTRHADYTDNDTTAGLMAAVNTMEGLAADEHPGELWRVEVLPRRTCADTALFDYSGLTVFASSGSYKTATLMGDLGYACNGVNSYLYHSFVAPSDALFGLRYLALDVELGDHPQLVYRDTVFSGDAVYYIYENTAVLPIAYLADSGIKDWHGYAYNPVDTINTLYSALTGTEQTILSLCPVEADDDAVAFVNGTSAFSLRATGSTTASFTATADKAGQAIIYVDCRAADALSVICGENEWSVTPYEPYFIDAGVLEEGDTVTVTVTSDQSCTGNIYMAHIEENNLTAALALLNKGGLHITAQTDRMIAGTVSADHAGTMVVTLPYDAGWRVTVDGKPVTAFAVENGGLLGFDLSAGEHDIRLTYYPRGLTAGLIVSGVSILVTILLVQISRAKRRKKGRPAHVRLPVAAPVVSTKEILPAPTAPETAIPPEKQE